MCLSIFFPCPYSLNPFLQNHPYSPFGADEGTDTAALAIIQINFYPVCFFIAGDAKFRAEKSADITGRAGSQAQALLGGFYSLFFP